MGVAAAIHSAHGCADQRFHGGIGSSGFEGVGAANGREARDSIGAGVRGKKHQRYEK